MKRFLSCLCVGFVLFQFTSGLARAGVILAIDDARQLAPGVEDPNVYPVGQSPYGFDLGLDNIFFQPETLFLSGMYTSSSSNVGPNFNANLIINFYEPGDTAQASDTVIVSFITGTLVNPQAPPTALQVSIVFRSDGNPTQPLSDHANFSLIETGDFMQLDQYIQAAGGPTDFSLSVRSDVPEPSTIFLLGSALLVISGHRFLRLRRKR